MAGIRECLITHTFDGEVEAAQSVSRQRISPTLEHNSTRLVHLHDFSHDLSKTHTQTSTTLIRLRFLGVEITQNICKNTYRFKDGFIGLVINTVS